MTTAKHAPHDPPRAGGSRACLRRSARAAWKNALRRHTKRAAPPPARGALGGDRTAATRGTGPSRPTQSA